MIRRPLAGLGLAAALAAVGAPTVAQVPEHKLSKPDATFPEAFSLIQGLRELPDGRVMIADPLGQALVVADLRSGRADTLGKVGQGPREYRQPDGLFALPGDSTLLVDLGNARLTVLGPDGSFGATTPLTQGESGPGPGGGLMIVLPRAVDGKGRVYFQGMMGGGPGQALPDSAPVMRWDRGTGRIDTVAMVKIQELKRSTSGATGNQNVMVRPVPLSPQDAWTVGWDGRLALVRSAGYYVEWVNADGRVVRGGPVTYRPVPVRTADKEEWVAGMGNGVQVSVSIENGRRSMSMRRGGGAGRDAPDLDSFEWPEVKPAFTANGAAISPDGALWVERYMPAGSPRAFDVFAPDAKLVARVVLPAGRRLVGFGKGVVYLAWNDEFDLQYLERHRRPTGI